ncbi:MAG: hypothetical protein ACXAAH_16190, partial [Promethearchaeota archaeon]
MKRSEDEDISQEDVILVQEEKKDPISQFFTDFLTELKEGFEGLKEISGEYFLNVKKGDSNLNKKKNISSDWQKFKLSWKNFFDSFKDLS